MTQTEIDYPIGMCVIYKNSIGVVTEYTKNRRSVYVNGRTLANQYPVYYANSFDVNAARIYLQSILEKRVGIGYSLIVK